MHSWRLASALHVSDSQSADRLGLEMFGSLDGQESDYLTMLMLRTSMLVGLFIDKMSAFM